jgi:hypothetical protein
MAALGLMVVALVGYVLFGIADRAWQHHEHRVEARQDTTDARNHALAVAAASRLVLPSGYAVTDHLGGATCPDGPLGEVRCYNTDQLPDQTTAVMEAALRQIGAAPGQPSCSSRPAGHDPQGDLITPPIDLCVVRGSLEHSKVDLVAQTNVIYPKPVKPQPGHRFVPPTPQVQGTVISLTVI